LRPANPVPPGKKLRCPKCETVFAPTRDTAGAAKPAAKPAAEPARPADDEQGGSYALVREDDEAEKKEAAALNEAVFSPIKDRFKRSARGPALIEVVRPSDWLLRTGVAICIAAIIGALWAVWPMIFKVEEVQPEEKGKVARVAQNPDKRRFKELSEEDWRDRWMYFGISVFQFVWGAVVCVGASKMHTLESYPLAVVGSVMALNGPGTPLGVSMLIDSLKTDDTYWAFVSILLIALPGIPMGLWCLATLRKPAVRAGFAEEKPED
jgi:hypothetical protein